MKFPSHTLAAALLVASSVAFVPSNIAPPRTSISDAPSMTGTALKMESFLDNLPNPFESAGGTSIAPRPPSTPPPITNEPEALFTRARAILSSDLGITDASFLADNFEWIGPNAVTSGALDKEEYVAAGKFFSIRSAFPDLDYRAHDFRIDPVSPLTVRLTARTVGTMRGELRLRSETLPPNGVRMVCPPEAISMTFDEKTGKLVKLCSGFTMDRLVGNTGGLCGVMAAATVAGSPPSEWEVYPPATVISRFFGRSVQQLNEPDKIFLAPFPETVMIQLAKGVLSAEFGTQDPDLLADEFTFCGPFVGPLKKDNFVETFSGFNIKEGLPDLDEGYSNFRVDPYDPYRIWFDSKATGTRSGPLVGQEPNGAKYIGPPEAASLTFDDNGFCTRLTAGAVMDPMDCNTDGLGGAFGILYATGVPLPPLTSRPLPQAISSFQNSILSPFTGKDSGVSKAAPRPKVSAKPPVAPKPPSPPAQKKSPIAKVSVSEEPADPVTDVFSNLFSGKSGESKESTPKKAVKPAAPKRAVKPAAQKKVVKPAAPKKAVKPAAPKKAVKPAAPKEDVVANQKAALRAADEKRKKLAVQNKAEAEEKRILAAQAAKAAFEDRKATAQAKKRAAEEKRAAAIAANELKFKEMEEKRATALAAKGAKQTIAKAKKGATISLGFFNFGSDSDDESTPDAKSPKDSATAPRGVPTLTKWYQNNDGSITGLISGSDGFAQGESITTSPVPTNPSKESVVSTVSGSKYFLDGKPSSAPWFNLFGGAKKTEPSTQNKVSSANAAATAAGKRKQAAEEKKAAVEAKKAEVEAAKRARQELAEKRKAELVSSANAAATAAGKRKQAAEEKKAAVEAKKAEVEAAKRARQELAEKKKAELEAKKAEAKQQKEALVAAQREKAIAAKQQKKAPSPPAKKKVDPKAAGLLAKKKSGTISLKPLAKPSPGFVGKKTGSKGAKPPPGVPVINKFKANRDGSISGLIYGSKSFNEGERVTTSKLAPNQKVEGGNVVTTVSGSKYFLK